MMGLRVMSAPVALGVGAIGADYAASRERTPDCDSCAARKKNVKRVRKHLSQSATRLE